MVLQPLLINEKLEKDKIGTTDNKWVKSLHCISYVSLASNCSKQKDAWLILTDLICDDAYIKRM